MIVIEKLDFIVLVAIIILSSIAFFRALEEQQRNLKLFRTTLDKFESRLSDCEFEITELNNELELIQNPDAEE